MHCFLNSENLLEVVTQETPIPRATKWEKKNKMAKNCLMSHLDDSLLPYMRGQEITGKMAMDKLDEEFERTDSFRQVELKSQIFDIKLGSDTVAEYFIKHEAIVARLTEAGGVVSKIVRLAAIIKGLPESYNATSEVLTSDKYKQPNLAEVKGKILQRETRINS